MRERGAACGRPVTRTLARAVDELIAALQRYFGIKVRAGAQLVWREAGVDWSKPETMKQPQQQ